MAPRDITAGKALLVGKNSVETLDVDEFLRSCGWVFSDTVADVETAAQLLAEGASRYKLVVLAAAHATPGGDTILRLCAEQGCPVIVINGALSSPQPGCVALLNRPFMDSDLQVAMRSVGLTAT
ncbi:MAG: hypothetical protein AAF218_04415 [Pseudomonadota bacterium]